MFKDLFSLQGRIALVTGGSRGIGKMIAAGFLAQGAARVYISARKAGPCEATAKELTAAYGGECIALPIDISTMAGIEMLASEIKMRETKLDILVNNAGITRDMTFKKMTKADWDVVIHTNLDSAFNMSKQVCDGMVERGWGRIVNVSSVNGSKGAFGQTNYAAAKAGMHGFTKSLALEVAKKGVTVNTISPGYIGTKMVTAIPKEVLDSKILPQIPIGRLGKPEEIAGLIIYLCSDEAAFVTGAILPVDGGVTARMPVPDISAADLQLD